MDEYTLLSIQVYGLAIVISMLVAVMIRGVVGVLSVLEKKTEAASVPAGPIASASGDDGHIAAITAAVWAMSGHFRIVHIEPGGRGQVWTTEGRLAHHASHAVEHHSGHWNTKRK
uniref:Oxaloacetate decarboxylase, gamma chain n=1 Tax=Candidatus Kentrum sp. DK TaxID=2126562 RepID=A0A450SXQ9_9GAMM|nr:MAG: hypothetical protein BECKDK2373B_GA0170837_100557 [Candidatus Kentron sp. DK]VFJ58704.1 MAG: hypothetical protein BECKDK2373C_GA0170839_106713 [Candidatus Kentron sp. DK]